MQTGSPCVVPIPLTSGCGGDPVLQLCVCELPHANRMGLWFHEGSTGMGAQAGSPPFLIF